MKWPFNKKATPAEPVVEATPVFAGDHKSDREFHADTLEFLKVLCEVLGKSYGPLGSNTMIERRNEMPIITKDGYTILENLRFAKSQDMAIWNLIKRVSYNLVKTVGDGSTSAVLSASFMYETLSGMRNSKYTRKQMLDVLDRIVFHIENEIAVKYTHQIDATNKHRVLGNISNISNNNDLRIGDYIANVFSNLSYLSDVRIEEDPRDSTVPISHTIRYGFSFERGPAHNLYFQKGSVVVIDKPIVFMSYEFFGDHYEVIKKVAKANPTRNIVVVTEQTHQETLNDCFAAFLKGEHKIYVIKTYDLASESNHDEFLDLAIYTDTDVIRNPAEFKTEQLGQCSQVELFGNKTVFIGGQGMTSGTEFYGERVESLQRDFDDTPPNLVAKRGTLRVRLSKMNGVSVRVLVGGITEEEKKMRRYLVEDAVLACKSAMAKGFGFGGNITLFFAASSVQERMPRVIQDDPVLRNFDPSYVEEVMDRLVSCYFATFECIYLKDPLVFGNEKKQGEIRTSLYTDDTKIYDVLEREFKDIDQTNVLAPIDTDIQILKASVSIVGMLLSINQMI
jgi:chaperonin GroEL